MRYIELNPVRADMVRHPGEYPWSSYRVNAQGEKHQMVEPHEVFTGLGNSPHERMFRYRSLFEAHIDDCDIHAIRQATEYSVPLGGERFKLLQIERALGRWVGYAKRGRPGVSEEEGEYSH